LSFAPTSSHDFQKRRRLLCEWNRQSRSAPTQLAAALTDISPGVYGVLKGLDAVAEDSDGVLDGAAADV
jgi:hypothetical protein